VVGGGRGGALLGDPVADRGGAPEGDDDLLRDGIDGDEASGVEEEAAGVLGASTPCHRRLLGRAQSTHLKEATTVALWDANREHSSTMAQVTGSPADLSLLHEAAADHWAYSLKLLSCWSVTPAEQPSETHKAGS